MINIKVGKNGKTRTVISIRDSNAPEVHTLARDNHQDYRNIGLENDAHDEQHKELVVSKYEDFIPQPILQTAIKPEENKVMQTFIPRRTGRGRGRGRLLNISDNESWEFEGDAENQKMGSTTPEENVLDKLYRERETQANEKSTNKMKQPMVYTNVSQLLVNGIDTFFSSDDDEEVFGCHVEHPTDNDPTTAGNNVMVNDEYVMEDDPVLLEERKLAFECGEGTYWKTLPKFDSITVGGILPSSSSGKKIIKGSKKSNGYCLFLREIAKQTGTTGSIDKFIHKFDKNWQMLSVEDKQKWKMYAKAGVNR